MSNHGWYYEDELEKIKPIIITTVGYLFSRDKERVVLVTSIEKKGEKEPQYADPHLIPRGCVIDIKAV